MSEWDIRAAERRDFRHTKGDPEIPGRRPAQKNTRKWCKGKVGREHVLATRPVHSFYGPAPSWTSTYFEDYCTICGKIIKHFYTKNGIYPWQTRTKD